MELYVCVYVFNNKLEVSLHEINSLRALFSISYSSLKSSDVSVWLSISTWNSAREVLNTSYYPSTLARCPVPAYGLPSVQMPLPKPGSP